MRARIWSKTGAGPIPMADETVEAPTNGGGGGPRLDPCFQSECRAVAMILDGKGGRPPSDTDMKNARRLIQRGKKSPFTRNQLAAARVAVAVAEAERRHVRWAMDFAQRERHHQDKMRGFMRRTDVLEQRAAEPGAAGGASAVAAVHIIVHNAAGEQRPVSTIGDFYAATEIAPAPAVPPPENGAVRPVQEQGPHGGPAGGQNGHPHRGSGDHGH